MKGREKLSTLRNVTLKMYLNLSGIVRPGGCFHYICLLYLYMCIVWEWCSSVSVNVRGQLSAIGTLFSLWVSEIELKPSPWWQNLYPLNHLSSPVYLEIDSHLDQVVLNSP